VAKVCNWSGFLRHSNFSVVPAFWLFWFSSRSSSSPVIPVTAIKKIQKIKSRPFYTEIPYSILLLQAETELK
jgi:hypothetical protein